MTKTQLRLMAIVMAYVMLANRRRHLTATIMAFLMSRTLLTAPVLIAIATAFRTSAIWWNNTIVVVLDSGVGVVIR